MLLLKNNIREKSYSDASMFKLAGNVIVLLK